MSSLDLLFDLEVINSGVGCFAKLVYVNKSMTQFINWIGARTRARVHMKSKIDNGDVADGSASQLASAILTSQNETLSTS